MPGEDAGEDAGSIIKHHQSTVNRFLPRFEGIFKREGEMIW
jgi:hypothetical protein